MKLKARSVRWLPIALLLGAGSAGGIGLLQSMRSAESYLAEARECMARSEHRRGLELARRAVERDGGSVRTLLFAADAAIRAEEPLESFEFLRRIPEDVSAPEIVDALKRAGQISLRLGRAEDAEYFYQRAARLNPNDLLIHRRLAALYLAEARRWESTPHLFALVRGKEFTLEELAFLGNIDELYDSEPLIGFFEESQSGDIAPLMGRARLLMFKNFPDEAEALLEEILGERPDLVEAQAQYGVLLVSQSRDDELLEWNSQLPPAAEHHPEIWWVRATYARRQGNNREAIRCAWESLRLDPNHRGAAFQLAQLLAAEGRTAEAAQFADRAARLELLSAAIHEVLLKSPTAERIRRCARHCEDLGRLWEAWAWHVALETYHPQEADAEERDRLRALLAPDTPQTLPAHCLGQIVDLSEYPLPRWDAVRLSGTPAADGSRINVRFEEVSGSAGLSFQYENGARPDRRGMKIYQSIGGGVAVIDFDCDGSPDLFFPQGGLQPPNDTSEIRPDRLFRNRAGDCRDVTVAALPADRGFGYGAAAGDFNADGFTDLYVANAGRNSLLQNCGDGSFEDVSDASGIARDEWTASCAICDLNGDGLPDLYDVNYCAADRPYEHICRRSDGESERTCIPTEFEAGDDRLLVNAADGRFAEAGADAGLQALDGRGLGIVAANLDDRPGLDLFIANDMTANFLFANRTPAPGAEPRFEERGVLSGTAYDSDGRSQACMGVAADDADGDGLIDLFVTNFYNESNTLYQQQPGGYYMDVTRDVGLRAPSMSVLGWGTQFLDAELDGRPDLVVVNGHVDDFSEQDIPYRMRPQFFSSRGDEFVEAPSETLGPFFRHEQLGRGLSRLDWNRDGQDDFVVSRMLEPAALVLNRTPCEKHYLAVRLVGRQSREGIGAEVEVQAADRRWIRQMTAGDGFAASNQRQLIFGLGGAAAPARVTVRWPGGGEQSFADVAINRELLLIEGWEHPLSIPGP